jgi:hypothetical protein
MLTFSKYKNSIFQEYRCCDGMYEDKKDYDSLCKQQKSVYVLLFLWDLIPNGRETADVQNQLS